MIDTRQLRSLAAMGFFLLGRNIVSVGETVGTRVLLSAKYWSEWQDLNLRPPRPNEVYPYRPFESASIFHGVRGRWSLTQIVAADFAAGPQGAASALSLSRAS